MRSAWRRGAVTLVAVSGLSLAAVGWAGGFAGGHQEFYGPGFEELPAVSQGTPILPDNAQAVDRIHYWNEIMLAANALDHTPVAPEETRVFGEQAGPHRTARAFAIVHIAIFDAVNAIRGGYKSYTGLPEPGGKASLDAAIAQAAHDTLVALYPSQAHGFDAHLASDIAQLPHSGATKRGRAVGAKAAAKILALRKNDGSDFVEPRIGIDYITSDAPGQWRQDPISLGPLALGAYWGEVKPFVLRSGAQFRVPSPPSLTSRVYAEAFDEVLRLGGDGVVTPTERTAEQTMIGIAWAYDGTPGLGTPPRALNQITVQIADQMQADAVELARLLALVNVAMADTAIAAWESKYRYSFWRPVTGIREADEGTGPTGAGDGNPRTAGDPNYTPLGAPASNLNAPNFSPPFPAYPSGHAGFGAATFEILRGFYGTDDIAFTFMSDEYDGMTLDNMGQVREGEPLDYASLSEAEEELGQSRIYLGIHWSFDKTEGIMQGRRVADFVEDHVFQPVRPRKGDAAKGWKGKGAVAKHERL